MTEDDSEIQRSIQSDGGVTWEEAVWHSGCWDLFSR